MRGDSVETSGLLFIYIRMWSELVDASDLGSDVERRTGSSPVIRTKEQQASE